MPFRSASRRAMTWHGVAALILLTTSMSTCAAKRFDQLMLNWHGHRLPELLATWGPPRFAYSDGDGGFVLLYVPASEDVSRGPQSILASGAELAASLVHGSVPDSQPVFPASITTPWRVFRLFVVGADGRISRSQWK